MSDQKIIAVVAQINVLVGDISGNAERIISEARLAKEKWNADIVIFPELALCGYPPEDLLLRAGFYARCQKALDSILSANIETTIIMGYPAKIKNKCFNQAAIIQNGHLIATYSKQKLPNYTVFDEKRYFFPGNSPCVIDVKGLKIGIIICEDLWKKEPCLQASQAGAQLIVCINASPFDSDKARAREHVLKLRTQMIQAPIIYANLVGGQDELVFDGGSTVFNEKSEHCQQAAYFQEDHMVVTLHPTSTPLIHCQPLPQPLSLEQRIYQALVLGVKDYINKNKFPGAIIGLSGGIDSALTLAIACDAIGSERVEAVMMPSQFSASMSLEDAKKETDALQVRSHLIEINDIFKLYLNTLAPLFKNKPGDKTEENLQARIRGSLLMALSNKFGSIVLTTGNKSEMSVGYATLYGDMAGGFCVLKDVYKTLVYQLARFRNSISPIIPERVLTRPPTAELAENQCDQDTLPPYPILDEILYLYIEKDLEAEDIYSEHLDKQTVDRVIALINFNEYKRRQAPIGIRITKRAFGKDRRYPITSGYAHTSERHGE